MNNTRLINSLKNAVQSLYSRLDIDPEKKIYAKFSAFLFSDDFQPFSFYMKEIQETIDKLEKSNDTDPELYNYLSEKLSAQCTALTEAVLRNHNHNNLSTAVYSDKSAVSLQNDFHVRLQSQEWNNTAIARLPAATRLIKYYEYKEKFYEELDNLDIFLENAVIDYEESKYLRQIHITEQELKKLLEHIEYLEGYLKVSPAESLNSGYSDGNLNDRQFFKEKLKDYTDRIKELNVQLKSHDALLQTLSANDERNEMLREIYKISLIKELCLRHVGKILRAVQTRQQPENRLAIKHRLENYRGFLKQFDNKINRQKKQFRAASTAEEKRSYYQQIKITLQRRKRCLKAIELLEEYLAFTAEEKM